MVLAGRGVYGVLVCASVKGYAHEAKESPFLVQDQDEKTGPGGDFAVRLDECKHVDFLALSGKQKVTDGSREEGKSPTADPLTSKPRDGNFGNCLLKKENLCKDDGRLPISRRESAGKRQGTPESRQESADKRRGTPESRQESADKRQCTQESRQESAGKRQGTPESRQESAGKRQGTPESRQESAGKRRDSTPESRQESAGKRRGTPESRQESSGKRRGTQESWQRSAGKRAQEKQKYREFPEIHIIRNSLKLLLKYLWMYACLEGTFRLIKSEAQASIVRRQEFEKTIVNLTSCPKDAFEWNLAAQKMNCQEKMPCSPKECVYHCVVNARGDGLVEVCAPKYLVQAGYCPELNRFGIQHSSTLKANSNDSVYYSNQVYKHQECLVPPFAGSTGKPPTVDSKPTTLLSNLSMNGTTVRESSGTDKKGDRNSSIPWYIWFSGFFGLLFPILSLLFLWIYFRFYDKEHAASRLGGNNAGQEEKQLFLTDASNNHDAGNEVNNLAEKDTRNQFCNGTVTGTEDDHLLKNGTKHHASNGVGDLQIECDDSGDKEEELSIDEHAK